MAIVSVIVPVYNVERYIHRCIDSILQQTFRDFELVLIDDGSPDQCGAICDDYASIDSRVHVIHKENGGLSAARNSGIDWAFSKSDSEWLTFVDSDDWIHKFFLESLLSAVRKDNTCIAIGNALWTKGESFSENAIRPSVVWRTAEYYQLHTVNSTVAWGKLYNKKCFRNIRFPDGKIHEDEYVTYKILFAQEYISVIDQPIYAYFQNDTGITRGKWTPARLDALVGIEQQISFFEKEAYLEIAQKRFNSLLKSIEKSRDSIQKSELPEEEKRQYIRRINRQLRRVLLRYRKYGWLPFGKSNHNKQIYTNAFLSIRISRAIWGKVKYILTRLPIIKYVWKMYTKGSFDVSDIREVFRYFRAILFKEAILLQTPLHGNIGDHAIAEAERKYLNEIGITFCDYPWTEGKEKLLARFTPRGKLILIHGGGYLGQLWPNEEQRFRNTLLAYRKNRILVFPQTAYFDLKSEDGENCFQESKKIYESHPNLTILAREKQTFQLLKSHMPSVKTYLVPDMVMSLKWKKMDILREGALICIRNDKEKTLTEKDYFKLTAYIGEAYSKVIVTDTVVAGKIDLHHREKAVYDKLIEFASAKIVITDRLHGMIFAAITETPCIVVNSLSPKIEGCYEWLRNMGFILFAESIDDIPKLINKLQSVETEYDSVGITCAMEPLYDMLRRVT